MSRGGLAVAGVTLIGVGLAIGFGWLWPSSAERTDEVTGPVTDVTFDNDSGDVTVRGRDVRTTVIRQSFRYRGGEPDGPAFSVEGSTLKLHGCGSSCSVRYEVIVPRGTPVGGTVDSGDLELDSVGAVRVSADSGDIRLWLDRVERVSARADSGDIEVTVPSGSYRITGDTDSGDREIGVATDPASTRVLDLSTDSGDVTVRGR
ncbi:hypothetical protein SacmaDRAFT_5645 [Saccharomonospora marina XMU15]|uniref:DUF4097 domain-containing protein n=1 Tax=Saccharomonospora marina XMU15 TaxID=882083 RepID=H5XB31_9PSEU|nr:DUF4097 family beta strand repeat-containing protein [Saccharomonospora marina]EHR53761.1 hypothetical protein SacmaDRAFT_5645 [Saccharomonospora marina XMU15]